MSPFRLRELAAAVVVAVAVAEKRNGRALLVIVVVVALAAAVAAVAAEVKARMLIGLIWEVTEIRPRRECLRAPRRLQIGLSGSGEVLIRFERSATDTSRTA